MSAGTWAWVNAQLVFVPELEHTDIPAGGRLQRIQGSAHTAAVVDATGSCVGWCVVKRGTLELKGATHGQA